MTKEERIRTLNMRIEEAVALIQKAIFMTGRGDEKRSSATMRQAEAILQAVGLEAKINGIYPEEGYRNAVARVADYIRETEAVKKRGNG
jgi:urease gamma subunit